MKKLTILTSLSCMMKEVKFKNVLLNPDKYDQNIKTYANEFKCRLARIKKKYENYCFKQIEVINFFSPSLLKKETQIEIEDDIINLANADKNFHYLVSYKDNNIVKDYIDYVNRGIIISVVVLDVVDMGRADIIDLAQAMLLHKNIDFYIDFYDE